MLDLAELVVLNKFDRRGARGRAARRAQAVAAQPRRASTLRRRRGAGVPDDREPVQRSGHQRACSTALVHDARRAHRAEQWPVPRGRRAAASRSRRRSIPAARVALPGRDRRAGRARSSARRASWPQRSRAHGALRARCGARRSGAARPSSSALRRGRRRAESSARLRSRYDAALDGLEREALALLRALDAAASTASTAEQYSYDVRGRRSPATNYRETLSASRIPKVAPPRIDELGRPAPLPAEGEPAGRVSRTRPASIPYRRRARTRRACSRARARPSARTGASTTSPPGSRRAAVDRVRLGHALRRGPGRAARHLRQGRQLRRLDRHARRREEALLGLRPLRADHLGLDDDQRPGADHPRVLPERRHRPAGRAAPARERGAGRRPSAALARPRRRAALRGELPAGERRPRPRPARRPGRPGRRRRDLRADHAPRRCRACAARCRPTSSRRTRRRTPASSRPSSRCG